MKVVSLNSSISRRNGGVSEVSRRLAQELDRLTPNDVAVLGVVDAQSEEDLPGWLPLQPQLFPAAFPKSYGYAPGYLDALFAAEAAVVHTHGLWTYASWAARTWMRRTGRPGLVSPHGMLDPWALRNSRWKKRLVAALVEDAFLKASACIHAITRAEAEAIRACGLTNPICVIPNGVDLPPEHSDAPAPWPVTERRTLLYLGRIHPKKGLPALLEGWARARQESAALREEWQLVIAGWDQGGHVDGLRRLAAGQKIAGSISFIGPQFGSSKDAAYRNASAFVLPSLSEGLPLVVLEAWAHGLPVLMTSHCNLPEGFAAKAALQAEPGAANQAGGLVALAALTMQERRAMGSAGRALVERRFTWKQAAKDLLRVYRWLGEGAESPGNLLF